MRFQENQACQAPWCSFLQGWLVIRALLLCFPLPFILWTMFSVLIGRTYSNYFKCLSDRWSQSPSSFRWDFQGPETGCNQRKQPAATMSAVLFRSRPGYFQGSAKDTHDHHRHGENRNRLETETRNQRDGPGMVKSGCDGSGKFRFRPALLSVLAPFASQQQWCQWCVTLGMGQHIFSQRNVLSLKNLIRKEWRMWTSFNNI